MKVFFLLFLIWSCTALATTQSENEELKKRIEVLEKQQEELLISTEQLKKSVSSFFNNNLTLGGFYDGGYDFITGPDTDTQGSNSSNSFGLLLSADFGNKYRFASQLTQRLDAQLLNEHNDPNAVLTGQPERREYNRYTTITSLSQAYLEYTVNRKFNVQGGMGFVPFGYILQLRQQSLFVRQQGPQIVRNRELISPLWSGLHIHGSVKRADNTFGYNLYTFVPTTFAKYISLGGRLWLSGHDEKIIAGVSTQVGRDQNEMIETVGADVRFDFHPFQLRTEFAQDIAKTSDTWTAYFEPGYFVYKEEVLLYAFGDYYFGANHETGSGSLRLPDPYQKWEYGFGVNWLPLPNIRIRTGFTFGDYIGYRAIKQDQDRDFTALNFSLGVGF